MIENALTVGQLASIYLVILIPSLCVSAAFARWEANKWMKKGKGIF